ncbi:MAG: folB [Chitinophagaceae bacterium]|nr:folB [Chitinophagaceae bacterium]
MNSENSITVELSRLRFFAFHGLYEEEKKTGNEFEINVKVSFKTTEKVISKIHDTVNYVRLHAIVIEMMQHPEKLLETVAMKIAERIHEEFLYASHAEIQIVKLHPPMISFTGHVAVTYKKEF